MDRRPVLMVLAMLTTSAVGSMGVTSEVWKGASDTPYTEIEVRRFADNTWFYYYRGEPIYRWRETTRGNTFIELTLDQPVRPWTIRLYDDRCEAQFSTQSGFVPWLIGSWNDKPNAPRSLPGEPAARFDGITLCHKADGQYGFRLENFDHDLEYRIWIDEKEVYGVETKESQSELLIHVSKIDKYFSPERPTSTQLRLGGYSGGTAVFTEAVELLLLPKFPVTYELIEHYWHRYEYPFVGEPQFVQAGRRNAAGTFISTRAFLKLTAPPGSTIVDGTVKLHKFSPGGQKVALIGTATLSQDKQTVSCWVTNPTAAGRYLALSATCAGPRLLMHRSHQFALPNAPANRLPVGTGQQFEIPFRKDSTFSLKCVFYDSHAVTLMNGELSKPGVRASVTGNRLILHLTWPEETADEIQSTAAPTSLNRNRVP